MRVGRKEQEATKRILAKHAARTTELTNTGMDPKEASAQAYREITGQDAPSLNMAPAIGPKEQDKRIADLVAQAAGLTGKEPNKRAELLAGLAVATWDAMKANGDDTDRTMSTLDQLEAWTSWDRTFGYKAILAMVIALEAYEMRGWTLARAWSNLIAIIEAGR